MARRDRLLTEARQRLGDADYSAAWNDGSRLTFHTGVNIATIALQDVTGSPTVQEPI